jgi:clan AA aspartic protease (TIGR02281 family)
MTGNCITFKRSNIYDELYCIDGYMGQGIMSTELVRVTFAFSEAQLHITEHAIVGGVDSSGHYGALDISCDGRDQYFSVDHLRSGLLPRTIAFDVAYADEALVRAACSSTAPPPEGAIGKPLEGHAFLDSRSQLTAQYLYYPDVGRVTNTLGSPTLVVADGQDQQSTVEFESSSPDGDTTSAQDKTAESGDPSSPAFQPRSTASTVVAQSFVSPQEGGYPLDATVNGTGVHFIVDTGASVVYLNRADAIAVGIDLSSPVSSGTLTLADGSTRETSNYVVGSICIGRGSDGSSCARNVLVTVGPFGVSLLGLSFLNASDVSVTIVNRVMTLAKRAE